MGALPQARTIRVTLDLELWELVNAYKDSVGHATAQQAVMDLVWQGVLKRPTTAAQIAAIRRAFHEARVWAFGALSDAHKKLARELLENRDLLLQASPPDDPPAPAKEIA